jgi:2-amino-4-hydroxy-6-hydroxymethyldihydropteridine diphosphokinase
MLTPTTAYLSLGGNIGDSFSLLNEALSYIANAPDMKLVKTSRFYKTSPVSPVPQSDYINAACVISTTLLPLDLLQRLQKIERDLGKIPKPKDAPRPIDIDIVFYGSMIYNDSQLTIPHPHWKERLFVLVPLADLTSTITVDGVNIQQFVIQDLIRTINQKSEQVIHHLVQPHA